MIRFKIKSLTFFFAAAKGGTGDKGMWVLLIQYMFSWLFVAAAKGGAGGKGNAHFKTAVNQAPHVAEIGANGERFKYTLELRFVSASSTCSSSDMRALKVYAEAQVCEDFKSSSTPWSSGLWAPQNALAQVSDGFKLHPKASDCEL